MSCEDKFDKLFDIFFIFQLSIAEELNPQEEEIDEKTMKYGHIDEQAIFSALPKIAKLYEKATDGKVSTPKLRLETNLISFRSLSVL